MEKINIQLKLFMKFEKYLPLDSVDGKKMMALEEGTNLEGLMNLLGIPIDEPRIVVINGISHGVANTSILEEGDIVAFFAPVGGG